LTGTNYQDIFGGPGVGSNWYTHKLQQYGVAGGGVRDTFFIDDNPERAAGGSAAWIVVAAHVVQWSFQTSAPSFWWIYGGHDPLYMIFVPTELVDASGWTGFHLAAPSLANLLLPAFLWPFVHDFLPYGLAKISQSAIPLTTTSAYFRQACKAQPWGAGCSALASFDEGTQNWTHELVEAITDPYPFFGWSDAGKQPAWSESEIADICESNASPFGTSTVVRDTSVATYWSNADNACVPESRPSLTVHSPTAGQVVQWTGPGGPRVYLNANATDPTDGDISNQIAWTLDGALVGHGSYVQSATLALGSHSVQAMVTDSQGLTATATATLTVVASPPTATILAPASGAVVPAGSPLVLRGDAADLQDRPVVDSALVWKINGIVVGTGRTLVVSIPNPGPATIELTVTDSAGLHTTDTRTITVTPASARPTVIITQPADGTVITRVDPNDPATLTFTAVARNADGTLIPNAQIVWTDSIDGAMGTGATIAFRLSGYIGPPLIHHVTVTARSASGAGVTDTITVTVIVLIP
jgi:hypothetical protein